MNEAPVFPIVALAAAPFDPWQTLSEFAAQTPNGGAVASFVGVCRPTSQKAEPVSSLLLDHYPGFTEARIRMRAREEAQRFGLLGVLVIHRIGIVQAGQPIVAVGCIASHRNEAFAACEAMMDWLKTDAPFWKQEIGPNGKSWITPTKIDQLRRERHP